MLKQEPMFGSTVTSCSMSDVNSHYSIETNEGMHRGEYKQKVEVQIRDGGRYATQPKKGKHICNRGRGGKGRHGPTG